MKAKVRVVWLSRAFDGIGAFAEGPGCELT